MVLKKEYAGLILLAVIAVLGVGLLFYATPIGQALIPFEKFGKVSPEVREALEELEERRARRIRAFREREPVEEPVEVPSAPPEPPTIPPKLLGLPDRPPPPGRARLKLIKPNTEETFQLNLIDPDPSQQLEVIALHNVDNVRQYKAELAEFPVKIIQAETYKLRYARVRADINPIPNAYVVYALVLFPKELIRRVKGPYDFGKVKNVPFLFSAIGPAGNPSDTHFIAFEPKGEPGKRCPVCPPSMTPLCGEGSRIECEIFEGGVLVPGCPACPPAKQCHCVPKCPPIACPLLIPPECPKGETPQCFPQEVKEGGCPACDVCGCFPEKPCPPLPLCKPPSKIACTDVEPPACPECGCVVPPPPTGKTVDVEIREFQYNPSVIRIKVGDTVRWTNKGAVTHTVTSVSGPEPFSGKLGPGDSFRRRFETPGRYSYQCQFHPTQMLGTIIVEV